MELITLYTCNNIRDVITRELRARWMEGGGATELNWLSMEQGASRPHSDLGYTLSVTVMVTIMHIRIPLGRQQLWVARVFRDCFANPEYKVR